MTVESVDRALDDVRPYLIADGGNVEVVAVENGRVFLELQVRTLSAPHPAAMLVGPDWTVQCSRKLGALLP